jgi:hypothetical protein
MLKVALKHWIYEQCISVLFAGISHNFMENFHGGFKVGDKLSSILTKWEFNPTRFHYKYYNCNILSVDDNIIYFSYDNKYHIDIISNEVYSIDDPRKLRFINISNIINVVR